jgi:hypothetical protein
MDDRLSFILRTPPLVEAVVREALRRTLAARRLRDDMPDVRAFSNLALVCLEARMRSSREPVDPVGRHELEAATVRAAAAFGASKLARRLFRIPAARLAPGPTGTDFAVRDRQGRRHLVRLEVFRTSDERIAAQSEIGKAAATGPVGAEAPAIHFFSLLDGNFRSYPAVATKSEAARRPVRRVA